MRGMVIYSILVLKKFIKNFNKKKYEKTGNRGNTLVIHV